MNYIVSKYPLEYLSKEDRPKLEPPLRIGWSNELNTRGKEKISRFKEMIKDLNCDIQWLSICYNEPIYIYIFTENKQIPLTWFKKIGLNYTVDFGKCYKMQLSDNPEIFQLPIKDRFYQDNFEEFEEEILKTFLKIDIRKSNPKKVFCFKLTKENKIQEI